MLVYVPTRSRVIDAENLNEHVSGSFVSLVRRHLYG